MFFYFINLLTPVQLSGGLFAAMAAAAATAADFIDLCKRDQIFTHTHNLSSVCVAGIIRLILFIVDADAVAAHDDVCIHCALSS